MKQYLFFWVAVIFLGSCEANVSVDQESATATFPQFVTLDRAYIPPLYFTSLEDLEASRASFAELEVAWANFKKEGTEIFDDPQWSAVLTDLEEQIKEAGVIIEEGKDLKAAHEALEHLREVLMTARRRNQFDYFVDYLTAYHEPMEGIVLTAKETPPDQWTDATTSRVREILPEAEALWAAVQQAAFEPAAYDFDQDRQQKLQQFMAAETQALKQLKTALQEEAPISELRAAALGIKPPFAGLFQLFGNVEAFR